MKNTTTAPTARKNPNPWDVIGSTYYWVIKLDPRHEHNTTDKLTGYSKRVGENENQDKVELLRRKIYNLTINGYLLKATCIDFYQRAGTMIQKHIDPKILTLYPFEYTIHEANHDVVYKLHGEWLKMFYHDVNTGRDLSHLLRNKRPPVSQDQYLDITRHNFQNIGQLYTYAGRLTRAGQSDGAVNDFIRKVKAEKNWP